MCIQPLPWYVHLPNVTKVFQTPNIDNTRIAKLIEQDSIVKVGSVLQGECVGTSDVWLWLDDGIGFIPGYGTNSTYRWNDTQWTYYLQQSYKPLTVNEDMLLLDNSSYLEPERVVKRIGGNELETRYLVWLYWHYSRMTSINPIIPIAQSLLETANFTSWWFEQCNNLAGIGVTGQIREIPAPYSKWIWDRRIGQYREGVKFDTIEEGIKAHLGRLLGYWFKPDAVIEPTQQELIQLANGYRNIPLGVRGALQNGIKVLQGTWALDGHYTSKLLRKIRWVME